MSDTGAEPEIVIEQAEGGAVRSPPVLTEAHLEKTMVVPSRVADSPAAKVRAVEQRIKVGALDLLKAIEELTRATRDLNALERSKDLTDKQRQRLAACRRELTIKKKVLQKRLSAL